MSVEGVKVKRKEDNAKKENRTDFRELKDSLVYIACMCILGEFVDVCA